MKKILFNVIIFVFIFGSRAVFSQDTESGNLARVAVVPFENRTGSDNYAYLSESLSEAINNSMQKNFKYESIALPDIKKELYKQKQEIIKKDGSLKDVHDSKKNDEWNEIIKGMALKENLNADVIIYGSYDYDEESNEIIIDINIYAAASDTTNNLDTIRNPVDNTIFKVTETVGQNIVDQIDKMLRDAAKVTENKETEKPVEKSADGKRIITKEAVKKSGYSWENKKFSLGYFIGYGLIMNNNLVYTNFPSFFYMRIMPVPSLQLSLLTRIDSSLDNSANFNFFRVSFSAMAGYAINVSRWHFYIEAGPALGVGITQAAGSLFLMGLETSSGVDFLLTPNYSLGLKLNNQYLYDFSSQGSVLGMDLLVCAMFVF